MLTGLGGDAAAGQPERLQPPGRGRLRPGDSGGPGAQGPTVTVPMSGPGPDRGLEPGEPGPGPADSEAQLLKL